MNISWIIHICPNSEFVFTTVITEKGMKPVDLPLHFDFSFPHILPSHVVAAGQAAVIIPLLCHGEKHLLFRQFMICGRVDTPARPKYLSGLLLLVQNKKKTQTGTSAGNTNSEWVSFTFIPSSSSLLSRQWLHMMKCGLNLWSTRVPLSKVNSKNSHRGTEVCC